MSVIHENKYRIERKQRKIKDREKETHVQQMRIGHRVLGVSGQKGWRREENLSCREQNPSCPNTALYLLKFIQILQYLTTYQKT
jgi:hypothetical protein